MAIEKNNFKVSRFDSEFSPRSRETMSSDEGEKQQRHKPALESDDDDEFDDADSGAGSDDFDLLELGETGAEFCQIGNQTCSIPMELYDLPGLEDVLSVDVWNECLSEEERCGLAKFLPDMDQETFALTLKELFTGCNLHFGSPIKKLFDMLKGGLCEPRVALYREGLRFFQKRKHYHLLRKHQNNMVSSLCQIRDAWLSCRGYSIEEKLRVLNIMKSQKSLMYEKIEDLETGSSEEDTGGGLWSRKNKDRKIAQKKGRNSAHGESPSFDFTSRGRPVIVEPEKYGKQDQKGILKVAGSKKLTGKDQAGRLPSIYHGLDMDSGLNGSAAALPRQNKVLGYDSGAVLRITDQMRTGDSAEDSTYGMGVQRDRNGSRGNLMDNSGVLRMGRKHDLLRGDEIASDSFMGLPLSAKMDLHAYARNANHSSEVKILASKPSSTRAPYDFSRKNKYLKNIQQFVVSDQVRSMKGRNRQLPLKGNLVEQEEYALDSSFKSDDLNLRNKKWKTERNSPDVSYKTFRSSSPQMSDRILPSDFRAKASQEKIRGIFFENQGPDMASLKGKRFPFKSVETDSNSDSDSDSSEHFNDDGNRNPLLRRKSAYSSGSMEGSRSPLLKSHLGFKKTKLVKKDMKETDQAVNGITHSKKMGDFGEQGHMPGVENYPSKVKQKGKMRNGGPLHRSSARGLEGSYLTGSGNLDYNDDDDGDEDDGRQIYKFVKNGRVQGEPVERLQVSSLKAYNAEGKKKGRTGLDHSIPNANYLPDDDEEDEPPETQSFMDDKRVGKGRYEKKGRKYDSFVNDHGERSKAPLLGFNSGTRKRKGKEDLTDRDRRGEDAKLQSNIPLQIEESISLKRKAKRKLDADTVSSDVEIPKSPVIKGEKADMDPETKPLKKTFTLITPTVHTGFSFSIIHLLSAVRLALIIPLPDDSLEVGNRREEQSKKHEVSVNAVLSNEKVDANNNIAGQVNVPSLTVQEIVNRVRSNPRDPCILETQEPLQDLIRGVLKIFSSKTAPLGAKGWKVLAAYEKSTRSWSWIGPVPQNLSDHDNIEEVTSPEAWGLPLKMLVKLVDSFANWLKSGQDTLQQMGSLPEPPLTLLQFNLDEKERFRDHRAQKSLNTISPSSEEVRAYFRKEEFLRYSIPDRAFSYTAADGKKSIVAPLRRCGGKPTAKARDHFMLKYNRPPHVTILCLVRDAAARLPGSIGTRADVCTLIRDSQYIVEDVSDAQINQVVSGALDRLHYERDPCVQFDAERKLWVYLHREREEEDFEDDGTSSTKKWKRQKKDTGDKSDQGAVTVAYHASGEQNGYDVCSDLNVEPSCIDDDKGMELVSDVVRLNVEDSFGANNGSAEGNGHQGNSMVWEALRLNPTRENKLLCQENSRNEDFDDNSFGQEMSVGLLSASLS
ncbi:Nuclear factor related to kappa-B-binding protein [Quillaja saponaria]|uniref:Nuclear factor related to kappa-B-binding protein n=1 Tax=Quillaja saponaria TaxID=32244 RepID=A0AAD7QG90_QUISA|nr:Nuclear factor related to kappa-B-binding protein [Quillaja saponaria]